MLMLVHNAECMVDAVECRGVQPTFGLEHFTWNPFIFHINTESQSHLISSELEHNCRQRPSAIHAQHHSTLETDQKCIKHMVVAESVRSGGQAAEKTNSADPCQRAWPPKGHNMPLTQHYDEQDTMFHCVKKLGDVPAGVGPSRACCRCEIHQRVRARAAGI